ncbi:helix-turn-helix transcriptional regulator [Falsihalocynthiibacter sp. SS001]|uniref:helix-turn-helix transcriptional regulator n=1 Tax=Falsihalocynthiibacter sp. SS001 TaxID=3349698 RepID=UPI0036D2FCDF
MPASHTYLTLNQLLESFPVSRSTVYRLIASGQFPKPIKVGSRSLWALEDVDQAIACFAVAGISRPENSSLH